MSSYSLYFPSDNKLWKSTCVPLKAATVADSNQWKEIVRKYESDKGVSLLAKEINPVPGTYDGEEGMYKEDPDLIKRVSDFVNFIAIELKIHNVDADWKAKTPVGHCFCRYCLHYLMLRSTDLMDHIVLHCRGAPFAVKNALASTVAKHRDNSHKKVLQLHQTIRSHSEWKSGGHGPSNLLRRTVSSDSFFDPHLSPTIENSTTKDF